MTITAQSVCRRVVTILQDFTSVRWTLNELVRALNDAQREIVMQRPDLLATTTTITCVAGSKQSIPTTGHKLLDVPRNNSASSKRAVRVVEREILDAQAPNWHSVTQAAEIIHFMYDPRDPRSFWVYPPASVTAQLDVLYANAPTAIAEPGDGTSLPVSSATDTTAPAVVIGNLSVPDVLGNAVVDYMLYRLYLKDASYAGNLQRALAAYNAFANALGLEIKATLAAGPNANSAINPLYPATPTSPAATAGAGS